MLKARTMLEQVGVVFLVVVKDRKDRLARYLVALNKQNQTEARSHRIFFVGLYVFDPRSAQVRDFRIDGRRKYFLLWKGLDKIQPISS